MFSPVNLNLENEKDPHHSCFHWTLQAEIPEADTVGILTLGQLLSEALS